MAGPLGDAAAAEMEFVRLFAEQGTLDEIGIGSVRDVISDLLFPGMSTLHTRPRYLFFIPWLRLGIEADRVPSHRAADRLRQDEVRLIEALISGGEQEGVIGGQARARTRQLPSVMYWGALRFLGIMQLPSVTLRQYSASLDCSYQRQRSLTHTDDGSVTDAGLATNWHATLPPPPENLLQAVAFDGSTQLSGGHGFGVVR